MDESGLHRGRTSEWNRSPEIPLDSRPCVPQDWDPFSDTFARNLEALNECDPVLAAELLDRRPPEGVHLVPLPHGEWAIYDERAGRFRSSPNRPSSSARDLARTIWPEIRALPAIAFARVAAGYELREVVRLAEAAGARHPVLHVFARDRVGLDAALRLHDLSEAIAGGRLLFFLGERGLARYVDLMRDGLRPLPARRVRIFGERPGPWDRRIASVYRTLARQVSELEGQWASAIGRGYARSEPAEIARRIRDCLARALVIAGAGRRAAERAQAIASGLEGAGTGTILLAEDGPLSGLTPCAVAREVERFRPDIVIGVERFRPVVLARTDRLPFAAWCGSTAWADGPVFAGTMEFAVAEDPEGAAAMARLGIPAENIFTLGPATDPGRFHPLQDVGDRRPDGPIAIVEDAPAPPAAAGAEEDEAARVAVWLTEGLRGVEIALWGEGWEARGRFRPFARGRPPGAEERNRIYNDAAIVVHPRPRIEGPLLDGIAAGAFHVIFSPAPTDPIRGAFRDAGEVAFVRSREELLGRVLYYVAHAEDRARAAARARDRVLADWTDPRKAEDLMERLAARLGGETERARVEPVRPSTIAG